MDGALIAALWHLNVKMGGRCLVALHQKSHQPLHAHAHRTADAARARAVRSSSRSSERPVLTGDPALRKLSDKLATTGFAAMVLFSVVNVAVLFVVRRPAPRTSFS